MTDGLWWLPSLIVFGTAGIGVVVAVRAAAGRRRRLGASGADTLAALEQRAGVALVRTDDLVRSAEEEVDFASAQFGDAAASDLAHTVAYARDQLREAFHLHQQLADAVPDSDDQRRRWSERIVHLCIEVQSNIGTHTSSLDDRRALERAAPDRLGELRTAIATTEARLPEAEATLTRLSTEYASATFAVVADAPTSARNAIGSAGAAIERAASRVSAQEAAADALDDASEQLLVARHALDGLTRTAAALDEASAELASSIERSRASVDEARQRRDTAEVPEAASDISAGIEIVTAAIARATQRDGLPDPLQRLDALREAESRLDAALSSARSRQQRLDSARQALRGALFSARSHVDVASSFIGENRGRVGPDARTRLAEAERQLALAVAAADPVEALDLARQVSRLAQDADALAHYDAGPRTAPYKR